MKFGMIIAIAILPFAASCNRAPDPQPSIAETTKVQAQSGIAELVGDPQFAWLSAMEQFYPVEYQKVDAVMNAQINKGASVIEARLAMLEALTPLMLQHKQALRTASDGQLVEYLRRNTLVGERLLQEDAQACNDAFEGNLSPGVERPDATWKLMSDVTAQLLVAAHQAETSPTAPRDRRLSSEDFQRWREQMVANGATRDTFALLTDPFRKREASYEEKCRLRVLMMRSALALPDRLAATIALNIVATGV